MLLTVTRLTIIGSPLTIYCMVMAFKHGNTGNFNVGHWADSNSPEYAIRSYSYLTLHAAVGKLISLFTADKVPSSGVLLSSQLK